MVSVVVCGGFWPLWVNYRPNYMLKNVYFGYLDVTRSPTGRTIIDVWDVFRADILSLGLLLLN